VNGLDVVTWLISSFESDQPYGAAVKRMSKYHDVTVAKHGRNGRVFFIPLITLSLSGLSPERIPAVFGPVQLHTYHSRIPPADQPAYD
jgi:hypothetical protein